MNWHSFLNAVGAGCFSAIVIIHLAFRFFFRCRHRGVERDDFGNAWCSRCHTPMDFNPKTRRWQQIR